MFSHSRLLFVILSVWCMKLKEKNHEFIYFLKFAFRPKFYKLSSSFKDCRMLSAFFALSLFTILPFPRKRKIIYSFNWNRKLNEHYALRCTLVPFPSSHTSKQYRVGFLFISCLFHLIEPLYDMAKREIMQELFISIFFILHPRRCFWLIKDWQWVKLSAICWVVQCEGLCNCAAK